MYNKKKVDSKTEQKMFRMHARQCMSSDVPHSTYTGACGRVHTHTHTHARMRRRGALLRVLQRCARLSVVRESIAQTWRMLRCRCPAVKESPAGCAKDASRCCARGFRQMLYNRRQLMLCKGPLPDAVQQMSADAVQGTSARYYSATFCVCGAEVADHPQEGWHPGVPLWRPHQQGRRAEGQMMRDPS